MISNDEDTITFEVSTSVSDVIKDLMAKHEEMLTEKGDFSVLGRPLEEELLTRLVETKDHLASEAALKYILELRLAMSHLTKLVAEREQILSDNGIKFNTAFTRRETND
jgi:hypothetical protein